MKANPKVICVGAATQDIFLMGKALTAKRDVRTKATVEQFPLGSKIEIDEMYHSTGGGATNAAVTFARQGLVASFIGKIGNDPAGAEVLRVLRREGVAIDLAMQDKKKGTSYSTIMVAPGGERVVLVYRGASHELSSKEIKWEGVKGDWLYITSLAGNFDLLKQLLKQAKTRNIKVAFAPGSQELAKPKKLKSMLRDVDILLGNTEEMKSLFGIADINELMLNTIGTCQYIVVTDGPDGVYVSDSNKIYHAAAYKKVKVLDRLGAGDAFGSGFVSVIATGGTLAEAITLGSANATSVVQQYGAKAGILNPQKLKSLELTTIRL